MCAAMTGSVAFCLVFMKGLFAIYPLTQRQIIITVILSAIAVVLFLVICIVVNKCITYFAGRDKNFRKLLGR